MSSLVVDVGDLVGHPEAERTFSGTSPAVLRLGDAKVDGPASVSGTIRGTVDGVFARFRAEADIDLVCVRCLAEWTETLEATGSQHFTKMADEDGYAIEDRQVDLSRPATDELALAMPAAPVCHDGCLGLCPICGNDLNSDPCDGHGEESDSPFAALKDLFDS